ncbi:30S ribosomal protein S19 [Candidatus Woesearchaeota archaeon]|nr:30S ribosomal protein S19 [Candidatus Woesearchaeota archaeon]
MAKKEFRYHGKSLEEIKSMGLKEFAMLMPSKQRRRIIRGFTEKQKNLLKKIRENKSNIKTQCRDMMILPEMVGKMIKVHKGNKYVPVMIEEEMIGHLLGEFVLTRSNVSHNAPGVGATRSSASVSVK